MKELVFDAEFGIRLILVIIYFITLFISLISLSDCFLHCVDLHSILTEITQCFVLATIPVSLVHTWDHLTNFCKPKLQSQIVRIIWMVPVFCLESYFSMLFVSQAMYFQAMRELYEAYVIHCFMRLILQYLGEDGSGRSAASRLEAYPASMGVHKPPFCCLSPWQMGNEFVLKCKTGVFQYVVVRFINTILTTILFTLGLYEEGKYSITKPFIWMTAINFCSQTWALYSLFLFFLCVHKELHGMRPFSKFLCIKLIIFFSWWQALLIGIMVRVGRINQGYGHSAQEIAVMIRITIISCEMLIAAIAFMYAFPISEFPVPVSNKSTVRKLGERRSSKRLGSKRYAKLPRADAEVGLDSLAQPLTDRLLLQAFKMLSYWNVTPPRAAARLLPGCTKDVDIVSDVLSSQLPLSRVSEAATSGSSRNSLAETIGEHMQEECIGDDEATPPLASESIADPTASQLFTLNDGCGPTPAFYRSDHLLAARLDEKPGNLPEEIMIDKRRAHLHRGAHPPSTGTGGGGIPGEGNSLVSRASPNFVRRDPTTNISPSYNQLRSKSVEKSSLGLQELFHNNMLSSGRRAGGFTFSRALEQDFDRHATTTPIQVHYLQSGDTCSASSSSGCSADGTSYAERPRSTTLDVLNLATLSYTPPLSSLGTHSKAKGRGRSNSKGHHGPGSGPPVPSSWFEALWMSSLPADLQEDIGDLEAQIAEIYSTAVPIAQLKRLIKGNSATY